MVQRSSKHLRAQKSGRERDFGICQICGRINKPEGHHVIDYQYGGNATTDNIVTLCHKCHKEVHRGKVDLIRF
ncbi:MAG: HNH endonuclease [Clostridiales bacterium]|nr:HNH endonuclease [Clostridiales bacterium]